MMSSNIFACSTTSDNMSRKIDDEPCCYKRNTIPIWNSWNKYQCQNCGLFYYIIFTGLVRWWNKYVCQRLLNYAKEFFISNYFILVHHVTNCSNCVVYHIILIIIKSSLSYITNNYDISLFYCHLPEYKDFLFFIPTTDMSECSFCGFMIFPFYGYIIPPEENSRIFET